MSSKWEWRLRVLDPPKDLWLHVDFQNTAVFDSLVYLDVKIDRNNGVIIFKTAEDMSYFRMMSGT